MHPFCPGPIAKMRPLVDAAVARATAALAAEREAHAAIERNDARHAADIAAVRKRAEAAERDLAGYVAGYETELAVHAETRAEVERLRAAMIQATQLCESAGPACIDSRSAIAMYGLAIEHIRDALKGGAS